jgi:hypothetical protein
MDATEENIILVIPNNELGNVIYEKIFPWKSGVAVEEFARLQLLPYTSVWNKGHLVCVECQESKEDKGYSVCSFEGIRTIGSHTNFGCISLPDIPFLFKPKETIKLASHDHMKVTFILACEIYTQHSQVMIATNLLPCLLQEIEHTCRLDVIRQPIDPQYGRTCSRFSFQS